MANNLCPCGSGLYPERIYDGHGIYLTRACDKCRDEKLSHFRPDIMERYDADEAIEESE
jgi:hypothetical protein